MLIRTLQQLKDNPPTYEELHDTVYVLRDGDVCFYIGKSGYRVSESVLRHLKLGSGGRGRYSVVGQLIRHHAPASDQWQVEFWNANDIFERFPSMRDEHSDGWLSVGEIKHLLIQFFQPRLNTSPNYNPPPLPDRYLLVPTPEQIMEEGQPVEEGALAHWEERWRYQGKIWAIFYGSRTKALYMWPCADDGRML